MQKQWVHLKMGNYYLLNVYFLKDIYAFQILEFSVQKLV